MLAEFYILWQQHCHLRHCHRSIGQEGAKGESREHGQEGGKELRHKNKFLLKRSQKTEEKKFFFQNREFLWARFYPSNKDERIQTCLTNLLVSAVSWCRSMKVSIVLKFFTRNLKRTRCPVEGCSTYTNWTFKTTSMVFGLEPWSFVTGWKRTMFYWLMANIIGMAMKSIFIMSIYWTQRY